MMTEKLTCGDCKHFHLDGMFGIWCDINDTDYHRYNGEEDCPNFEKGCGVMTEERFDYELDEIWDSDGITETIYVFDKKNNWKFYVNNEIDAEKLCKKLNWQEATIDEQKIAIDELITDYKKLEKENKELNSIKKFAERNGINIFFIDEAFRKCWNDNAKLTEENEQLRKELKELNRKYIAFSEATDKRLKEMME